MFQSLPCMLTFGFQGLDMGVAFGQLRGQPREPFLQLGGRYPLVLQLLPGIRMCGFFGLQGHFGAFQLSAGAA